MNALGSVIAGGATRFHAVARALVILLVASLTFTSIAAAEHVHAANDMSGIRMMMADAPTGELPDECPLCHVNCTCHPGLPAMLACLSFERPAIAEPFAILDQTQPSASEERLKRPPRV